MLLLFIFYLFIFIYLFFYLFLFIYIFISFGSSFIRCYDMERVNSVYICESNKYNQTHLKLIKLDLILKTFTKELQ